jgi:GAF domain-containing protein
MSMAPHPAKVQELLRWLDTDFPAGTSLDSIATRLIPRLLAAWPMITLVRCYVPVEGARLRLAAAGDREADSLLEPDDPLSQMLLARQSAWDAQRALWGLPLLVGDTPYGLLAVRLAEGAPDAEAWLRLLSDLMVRTLERRSGVQRIREIADNLVLSSRLITTADSYADMAQAVIYTVAQGLTAVALTLFDPPLDIHHQPARRRVAALGTAQGAYTIDDQMFSAMLPQDAQMQDLWRGQPVIVSRPYFGGLGLTPELYHQQPDAQPLEWLAALGLRAGDQVLGTLEVMHTTGYAFVPEELDALTTLADQIGVAVRNRQLLQETADSLEETRQLYELNRQMLLAQDTVELLQSLRTLSRDFLMIAHNTLEYNARGQLADVVLRHMITPNNQRVIEQSVARELGDQAVGHMATFLPLWDKPIFVENVSQPLASMPAVLVEQMRQQGAGSLVMIPVAQQNRVTDLVRIVFAEPQAFDNRMRRLYNAVRDQMTVVLQAQRLLQETQRSAANLARQVNVLQTLNDLSTVISMARDESQLLNQSAQAMVTAMRADYCLVHLLDSFNQAAKIVSEYPNRGNLGQVIPLEALPVNVPLDLPSPSPIVINAVQTDPRIQEAQRAGLLAEGVRALMLLPLFERGRTIGGIRLDLRREDQVFTPEMVEIGQTILAQLAVGLQNIHLLEEQRLRSEQLRRVNRFGQRLQGTFDVVEVLEAALADMHQIIPVERMTIALRDAFDDRLRTAALYANGENYLTPARGALVPLEGSPLGRVWLSQQPLHIPDLSVAQDGVVEDARELRALLVTPLIGRRGALGVMSVGHSRPMIYADADLAVFQQAAGILTTALENARMYSETQQQVRNEALVNEITARLQQQTELEDMMHTALTDLGRALGARRARIRLGTQVRE